jgi:glutaredoxin
MVNAGISRYLLLIASLLFAGLSCASGQPDWVGMGPDGDSRVRIHVFWSQRCPHCQAALPFLEQLRADEPWLDVQDFEITRNRANRQRFATMAAALGEEARSVPAFFVCGRMLTGFDDADGIGAELLALARTCRQAAAANPGEVAQPASGRGEGSLHLPVIGVVDQEVLSLPVFTLLIAGLDAFNPCAFFVLLFLLSLMVHARSRSRMLQIGVTFVFFSGLVYFLFMATWLNLFLVLGVAPVVTAVAGCVAVLFGIVNVKDFFLFKRGATLSIPGQAMPGLFSRVRRLVSADRLGTMLAGTVVLALAANSYELLCTAGFPMVFTRVLTLNELPRSAYYGYLVLYNLVYVLPLLAIVLAFTLTLGTRKLTERQGRVLKLLSGLMMLGLGLVMLVVPDRLSSLWTGVVLLSGALAVTAVAARLTRTPSAARSGP